MAIMLMCVLLLNLFLHESSIAMKMSGFIHYAIYFLTGFVLKGIHDRYGPTKKRLMATSVICLILTGAVSVYFPGEILTPFTWQLPLRFIGAVAGIIGVLILSANIPDGRLKRFLIFCGDSTILILVWHFLCFKLLTFILINIHGLPATDLLQFPVHKELARYYWPVYITVGLVIPLGIQISWNFLKDRYHRLSASRKETAV